MKPQDFGYDCIFCAAADLYLFLDKENESEEQFYQRVLLRLEAEKAGKEVSDRMFKERMIKMKAFI
jgi:hypothetical protein